MSEFNIDSPEDEGEDTSWLGTFADICLLLLVFFILLYSMSSPEAAKMESYFGAMREVFGSVGTEVTSSSSPLQTTPMDESDTLMEKMRIQQELLEAQRLAFNEIRSYLTINGMEGKIGATLDEGTISLSVGSVDLFKEGTAELTPEAVEVLLPILDIVKNEREMLLNIKGFTDSSPLPIDSPFDTKWELTAMMAVNVLTWFLDQGTPSVRLRATGMGDLNPIYPSDTPENRTRNHRVEFELERTM